MIKKYKSKNPIRDLNITIKVQQGASLVNVGRQYNLSAIRVRDIHYMMMRKILLEEGSF